MTNEQPAADRSAADAATGQDPIESGMEQAVEEQRELDAKYDALKQEPGADNQEPETR